MTSASREQELERGLIAALAELKYVIREDIRDRRVPRGQLPEEVRGPQRVTLADAEFARLVKEIATPEVYAAARLLRERDTFVPDDGTQMDNSLARGENSTGTHNFACCSETVQAKSVPPDVSNHKMVARTLPPESSLGRSGIECPRTHGLASERVMMKPEVGTSCDGGQMKARDGEFEDWR